MSVQFTESGLFIPPHAQPLSGPQSFITISRKFLANPLESFSQFSYDNAIASDKLMGLPMHVVSSPEGMAEVLIKRAADFKKSPLDQRIMKPATREGLLSVHGEQWTRQRRGIAPMFQPRHMSDLAPQATEVINAFKAKLGERADVELNLAMADLTFDVLAKALLGDPQGLDRDRLKAATRRVVTSAGKMRIDDLLPSPAWVPRLMGPKGVMALRRLRKAADELLADRRKNGGGDDLVTLLTTATDAKTGEGLSAREQRDNLIGFFIAGHETTALTLTWALYLLGMHGPTQERLAAEVREVAGAGDVLYEHIPKLKFTRAVIDETMRLFPPAPITARMSICDTEILGRPVEKGSVILLANYVMHRTERLWKDPLVFDPDRFLREPGLNKGKDKFLPFGAGPRVCVGAAFAVMEAVMALATLTRDYEIIVPDTCFPRPVMTITLRPEGGIPATLKRRNPAG